MATVNGKEYSWVSCEIRIGSSAAIIEATAVKYPGRSTPRRSWARAARPSA